MGFAPHLFLKSLMGKFSCQTDCFRYRWVKRERERQIFGFDTRVSYEVAGGLFQVQVVKRDWKEKLVLCKCTSKTASHVFECVSPFPISPLSLTCKWQKDSVTTFDTCPLCFSECLDNCYGNCMSQRSVDWLIQAVSQTDEPFEPTCLFRSALAVMLWQPVWWLSPFIMEHIRCEKKHWCQVKDRDMLMMRGL